MPTPCPSLRRAAGACALAAAAAACARGQPAPAAADPAERIRGQVEAIAAGDSIGARRAAIVARLRAIGLEPSLVPFDPPAGGRASRRGENVVAEIASRGASAGTILLSAHYDRVERGRGVIDNAAGAAVVLELAEALRRRPLERHAVKIALFDLEEAGLLGSRAMAADSMRTPLPAVVLNFDIFGYGSAVWIGAADSAGAPVPRAIADAGRRAGLEVVVDSLYPPSDHLSFRRTSARSYAVSLVDRRDIDLLLTAFRTRANPSEMPKVMGIIHGDGDTMDKLDAAAVARGVRAVEEAIRAIDAGRPFR